ncbi:MAG: SRPBCC family protein, partial [Actinomycetota bacterium]|nr:SRPBCC family protein [Actinomycetota bacterium]
RNIFYPAYSIVNPSYRWAMSLLIDESVEVGLPAGECWAALIDWESQRHWVVASKVTVGPAGARDVGGTMVATSGWGRVALADPMEITVWAPPRRVELTHTGRLVHGQVTFEVTPVDDHRSRLRWAETLQSPVAVLRPLYAVGTYLFARMVRYSLRRFRSWAPTRPVS